MSTATEKAHVLRSYTPTHYEQVFITITLSLLPLVKEEKKITFL